MYASHKVTDKLGEFQVFNMNNDLEKKIKAVTYCMLDSVYT